MQELLPHYERELSFLRIQAAEFARRHPKIAGRLLVGNEAGEDPHVQRLVESFALLTSRIHKRLDDDFPLFTESLLEVLYPHYLRPFPSCSIASFDIDGGASQMTQAARVERGTVLTTRPVRGVPCRFRTAYDVTLMPVRITEATFTGSAGAPEGSRVPREATSMFSVQLTLTSPQATWATLGVDTIRIHLDGDSSQVSALREALCGRVLGALVQTGGTGPWVSADQGALPRPVGFGGDEALIDFDARSQPAYRLLTEYFAFPEKFNFVDLELPASVLASPSRSVTLHFAMSGLRADSDEARLLETVTRANLKLACAPVVNLFEQKADPIRVTHASASHPVLPDGRRAFGFEVYSIDKVYRVQQTPEGDAIAEFKPFYSLRHDELLTEGEDAGRYWYAHRDEGVAERSPGFETELSIVDINFNPSRAQTDTLSIDVTATNRDLPSSLTVGNPDGDLFMEGAALGREVRLLRKPSLSVRFERGKGALWRLISHLSLNHLSLSAGGIEALREMLRLYDLSRSAANRRQIAGLVDIDFRPTTTCLPGNPFATFVRGIEIRIVLDERAFVGTGLRLFAQVLDRFFGLYVHANSFTQLKVVSAHTHEELMSCPRRSGDGPLL